MYEAYVPNQIFLTKGIGRHKEKLASFEEALRDAKIACYNIVPVSSIFPPHCKIITKEKGVKLLKPGQILPYTKSSPIILNFAIKDDWKDLYVCRHPQMSRTLHEHQSYFYCFFIITFLLENKPDFCEYQEN